MTKCLRKPNLPDGRVTSAAVDSRADGEILSALIQKNIRVLLTPATGRLPQPVDGHPDMMIHHLGDNRMIVYKDLDSHLKSELQENGFQLLDGVSELNPAYPADVAFNCARVGDYLFARPESAERSIMDAADPIQVIAVRQGYAKCSICPVDGNSIITSDPCIADAAERYGIDVLKIREGYIRLPGYSHGFIGGTCGKLGPDLLCFFGNVRIHPDYDQIVRFLAKRGIRAESLGKGPLTDYGSLIPLTEE